ncbi:MAG: serine/threonine protein kinase [Deltaproteobacteria bacterium]|nr:serine/threonine protein kinase [Deltaproteobacteria bacterium]
MDPAELQISAGDQVGPYVVSRRLGAGGMGEVYLARHRHLDRDAAVKVLLPEISMNQTVVARFFTEARATAQLRHPNIVEIFDCDVLPDGRAYIVMEYLRGESLRQTLDRVGRLVPAYTSIAAIAGMVADALHAAHEAGIVHRDLKPDNTYLTVPPGQRGELTVKVLDFGIAKLLSGSGQPGSSATRTGALIGTPLYMSPEQCRGIPNIDHRADIYSLGCVLFEMVVGQPPFVAEAPGDILMAHMVQQPPPLSTFDSSVPQPIDFLVARMLAKDPLERPQSMAEIVSALEAFLGTPRGDFTAALRPPPGFPEQVAQAATQILPPASATPARQTPPPKQPTPIGLAGSTEIEPAATPSRLQRTPARSPSRRGGTGDDARFAGAVPAIYAPERPKWLLPVGILLAVLVLGGVGAYLLSRPKPLPPPAVEPLRPAKPEPAPEPEPAGLAKPGRFVPPPGEPAGPAEPEISEREASLDKSASAERDKTSERKSRRRRGSSARKPPEPESPKVIFKAVGD